MDLKKRAYAHAYYLRNKEKWAASRARQDRTKLAARTKKHRLTAKGRAAWLVDSARKRAKQKERSFSITRDWVMAKIAIGFCEMSGLKFELTSGEGHNPYAPSIDRVDSRGGYTKTNCRVILWCLNTALGEWGEATSVKVWRAVLARKDNG